MNRLKTLRLAVVLGALAVTGLPVLAQDKALPPFPKKLLDQPDQITLGVDVFQRTCRFCHGKTAYPGKAPKLNPTRYQPEFVYDRVTNGFRGMPPMKDMLSDKERQAVTVYIMSKDFSN